MEHAHSLCLKALHALSKNHINGINQADIAKGHIYYSKDWRLKQKIALIKNKNKLLRNAVLFEKISRAHEIQTFPIQY